MNKSDDIVYKTISNFPNYKIGTDGSVWKKAKSYRGILGYERITLIDKNRRKITPVHRLVAQAFISNPDNLPQVNHKNGVRHDNRLSNVEWCTAQENVLHGWHVNGRKVSFQEIIKASKRFGGSKNPKAKLTKEKVEAIRTLSRKGLTRSELSKSFKVSTGQIGKIINYHCWHDSKNG